MNRPGVGLIRGPGRDWSFPMIRLFCLIVALGNGGQGAAEPTDWMKPVQLVGKLLGPGCNASPALWRTSAAAHERGDDALEQLGPERAP